MALVVIVLAVAFFAQDDSPSCPVWRNDYLALAERARPPAPDQPPPDLQRPYERLLDERPGHCGIPDVPPDTGIGGATATPAPTEAPLPPTLPVVTADDDTRLEVRGFRADLVDDDTVGRSYVMELDLQWVDDSEPQDVLCDLRFLDAQGESMYQRDVAVAFAGNAYLDDFTLAVRIDDLQLYIDANGPPAAATVMCSEDL